MGRNEAGGRQQEQKRPGSVAALQMVRAGWTWTKRHWGAMEVFEWRSDHNIGKAAL